MDRDITPFIVHEAYLEDHRHDGRRAGEGAMEVMHDGSLLVVYGQFEGLADHDRATLVQRRSYDGGRTWTAPIPLVPTPSDVLNLMSVSLLRLADGRLACIYLRKASVKDCRPLFMTSQDDGLTWGDPVLMIDTPGYYVGNNDRLIQLKQGRLVYPVARHERQGDCFDAQGHCSAALSDDAGLTWRMGDSHAIEKAHVRPPRQIDPANAEAARLIEEGPVVSQEPGVIELHDGRLRMWCRSNGGHAYHSLSADGGESWSSFVAIADFAMPNGPQSIKRLPGSQRLVMLYNDRGDLPFGSPQFQWRRPLALAISDDEGDSWRRLGLLEPQTLPSACYYSITFQGDHALFTYYEGVMRTEKDGLFRPYNLTSLKLKVIHLRYFGMV